MWLGFTLQGLKSIRIAGCLSVISSGCISHMSSKNNSMELKDSEVKMESDGITVIYGK